jgi:hypothetical protein
MPGMTSAPRKGRRDFEPANCLNETGVDCTKVQARGFTLGWAATVMSPCGVVNCKVLGPQGPLLTNRMTYVVKKVMWCGGLKPLIHVVFRDFNTT